MNDGSERILQITMPWDRRNSDPKKNYGVGGMSFRMVYLKNNNAVQFTFCIPFYLPEVIKEWESKGYENKEGMGMNVGYHAEKPQYEGQSRMDNCDILSCPCYYDGSSLRADEWYKKFLYKRDAFDWAWQELAQEWQLEFSGVNQ
jgi:hypothetical protein